MSAVSFTGTEIIVAILLFAFIVLAFMIYRLISELILTLRQVRRTVREVERTIQNSQEIIYNMKSITRTMNVHVDDVGDIVETARNMVNRFSIAATTVTKPISSLRGLMAGLGYAAKYLFKRRRSDDYDDE
jgi:uncharacterized protein YoxC